MRQLLALILLVGSACSDLPESTERTTTTSSLPTTTTTIQGVLDVIVPPGPDASYPADLVVSCPSGPSFPLAAMEETIPLEAGDPDVAKAVSLFLEGEEGLAWPPDAKEGWLILHQDARSALVANPMTDGIGFMYLGRDEGGWMWEGAQFSGPCPLHFTVPEDLNAVEWRLDPSAAVPGPRDIAVHVLIHERECVSGQEIGDRLVGPQIVITDSQVFIAFAAEPPEGEVFDCQGNPETPYTVELPEPLGDREVVEGLGISLEDYLD